MTTDPALTVRWWGWWWWRMRWQVVRHDAGWSLFMGPVEIRRVRRRG